jgi:hypothetical protein
MGHVVFSHRSETAFLQRDILANIPLYRSLSNIQLDCLAAASLSI